MHRRHRAFAVAAVLALGVLAACGSGGDPSTGSTSPNETPNETPPAETTAPQPTTPPATALPETETATPIPEELNFSSTTLSGDSFDGASIAGTPTVLWFWAPWCPVCAREAPLIADLAEQYAGQVSFVGIAGLSGDLDAMQRFVDDGGVGEITHLDDRDGAVYAHFGVTQQYDIGFVAADGTVEIKTGPLEESEITAEVERLAAG